MGGVAGAAGSRALRPTLGRALDEPVWLIGGAAPLAVARTVPTLWLVDLDDPIARRRAAAVSPLPGEAEAFARHRDAGERLLRRRLARLLLAVAGDRPMAAVSIARDAGGAPVVAEPAGWHLSVAARWPTCLIGVAPMRLGVDVETIGEPLPRDLLTPTEARRFDAIAAADRPRAAARCWAAKEAHAKWTRRPRALDPASVETADAATPDAGTVVSPFGITRCWSRDGGDHVAAVCTA